MKMITTYKTTLLHFGKLSAMLFFLAVFLLSCKKEQPAMRSLEEDCDCAKEVSAEFVMEEAYCFDCLEFKKLFTETDSVFGNSNVRFFAEEENADYTWYIGSEVIKTREVYRYFSNDLVGQTIPIKLVIKKKANTICLPYDDGYDTLIKHLTIAQLDLYNNYDTTLVEGTFRMKSDLMSDSVDIIIDYYKTTIDDYFNFYNYDGAGSVCFKNIPRYKVFFTYRQIKTNPQEINNCNNLRFNVFVKMGGLVEMHFTREGPNPGTFDYLGRKL